MRYSRHILLEGFGKEGQEKLLNARVLIVGAGGLGSPCALYLAAAGVGTIGIADGDVVSLTNLQRQIIHHTKDIGRKKTTSAREKLESLNPEVKVITYDNYLTADNVQDVIATYDFILDCTDSVRSKYLLTDACKASRKPLCCGGVVGYSGMITTILPGGTDYRSIFPEPEAYDDVPTNASIGVLNAAVGIMGSIQACEAIKYLTGTGRLLNGRLLTFDTKTMQFNSYDI